MTALLDTDVLVDCLRGAEPARKWLEGAGDQDFRVPGIAAMELLCGCRNRAELQRTKSFLAAMAVTWPTADEFERAFGLLADHRLTTGLSIPDCLVAAMALSRSAVLYTFNLRHFRAITDLQVSGPYSRG